ncbi:MAG: N-acetylmuramoyl-L-alanine amidase, partial [Cohaesibacter sp.]|nr:N-acetylmuramoyl-L-alanine amidase [Cohaesibacter sp.]
MTHNKTDYCIEAHRLIHPTKTVPFIASPNQSAPFAPKGIILHDTAGRLDKGNSVKWFLKEQAKASAHLVLERDGSLTQMVAFDRKAWHAGKSSYQGKSNVNAFAIGIEIVNPGRCEKIQDGAFKPWFDEIYRAEDPALGFAYAQTKEHGKGWWLHYTKQQIQTVTDICLCLRDHYDLQFLTSHYAISPGRKIDPNPFFPLADLQERLFGKAQRNSERKDQNQQTKAQKMWVPRATPLRKWPSFQDNQILIIPDGAVLSIMRSGYYDNGAGKEQWHWGIYASQKGWIRAS